MNIFKCCKYFWLLIFFGITGCATLDPCYYYADKNYDKAIDSCSSTIAWREKTGFYANAYLATIYNNRGVAYLNKSFYDLAMNDMNVATKLAPDFGSPYFNRGRIYSKLRRYDLAIAEFDKAKRIDSKFSDDSKYNTYNNDIIRALLLDLQKRDASIHLAIIIGAVNTVFTLPNAEQWKDGIKSQLRSTWERYYAANLRDDDRFNLIAREKIDRVLNEQKFQNYGLTPSPVEFGQLIGATHLLIIDFARYSTTEANKITDVESHSLIEVKSGRVLSSQAFSQVSR
jgi:tetratricopeptide (TPR) repeat protein